MSQPHAHLAFAPRGPGLLYALMWFAEDRDVLGWFIGAKNGGALASYFVLQEYYAARDTTFWRTLHGDVDGDWVEVRPLGERAAPQPPLSQPLRRELSRLQDLFLRHWLFFDDDPDARVEAHALELRQLPVRHVNVRAERLDKLQHAAAVWHYDAPGADRNVLVYLSKRWPLDFDAPA